MTAERTGTLGMVTELMGEHYEEEGESKLRELATLLEPLIIVVMGVIVATIVMAVMLPMFDIAQLGEVTATQERLTMNETHSTSRADAIAHAAIAIAAIWRGTSLAPAGSSALWRAARRQRIGPGH